MKKSHNLLRWVPERVIILCSQRSIKSRFATGEFPWQFPDEDVSAAAVGPHARAVKPQEQPDEVEYTGPLIVDHIDKVPENTSGGRRGGTRGRASGSLKQKYLHEGDIEEILVYNVAYSKSTGHITESDHDAIRRALQHTMEVNEVSSEDA